MEDLPFERELGMHWNMEEDISMTSCHRGWLSHVMKTPLLSTFRRHPQAFREGGRRQPEAVSDAVRHDDRGLMLNSLDASRHATLVDMLRFSDSFRQKLALNPAEMTRYYKDECPTDPELTGRQRKYYSQIRQKIEQEMTMRNVEAGCVYSARI